MGVVVSTYLSIYQLDYVSMAITLMGTACHCLLHTPKEEEEKPNR